MKPVEVIGHVNEQHQLHAELPRDIPPGPVKITLIPASEEDEKRDWLAFVNHSWAKVWNDAREDIYTLNDGKEEEKAYVIPQGRFDNPDYIERRVHAVPAASKGSLRTALSYLYLTDGPINLPKDRRKVAEPFLEPAELLLARWLAYRTNGGGRRDYGANALRQARLSHYRCEKCYFPDVRALELDHVRGSPVRLFACLCANCHNIKSRKEDWTGK
jgi:hypothetical protein